MLLLLPMMLMSSMESAVKGQNSHRDPCTNRCHQVLLCWSYPYLSIIYILKAQMFLSKPPMRQYLDGRDLLGIILIFHLDAQGKADAWCGERRRSPDGRVMRCVEGSRCHHILLVNSHNYICKLSKSYLQSVTITFVNFVSQL